MGPFLQPGSEPEPTEHDINIALGVTTLALKRYAEQEGEDADPHKIAKAIRFLESVTAMAQAGGVENLRLPAARLTEEILNNLKTSELIYKDKRWRFNDHIATKCEVTMSETVRASALLKEILGTDANRVMTDWAKVADISFDGDTPLKCEAIVFHDSNCKSTCKKARMISGRGRRERSSQEEDFNAARPKLAGFADDVEATIVCAALVRKAKDAGLDLRAEAKTWEVDQKVALEKLSAAEIYLLTLLRVNQVRTYSGTLYIDESGRLRAGSRLYPYSDERFFAFARTAKGGT
ncbi:hypothetical protein OAO01_05215 [Oligoflexia bacterium]|nr:hypothetical protein [Oligoflexia bacterium]